MFQLFYWIGRQNNRKKPCTQTSQKMNKLTCKYISSCLCLWSSRCCCLKSSSLRRSSSSLRCSSSWRRISSCLLIDRQKQNISHWLRFWAGSICLVQNLSDVNVVAQFYLRTTLLLSFTLLYDHIVVCAVTMYLKNTTLFQRQYWTTTKIYHNNSTVNLSKCYSSY